MAESTQSYMTENPEPRKVEIERVEEKVEARVSPARPDYALDLSDDEPLRETRAVMDEQVGPDHPAAVIVPPEGRGVHADIGLLDDKSPLEKLESGDADEVTAVVDGETVVGSEAAAKAEKKLRERSSS